MALSTTFYKFAKKKNSTARPGTGTAVSVILKEDTDTLKPTIKLKQTDYPDYNYAYILEFDRYYFVNRIRWMKGIWELDLTVDVLASWKSSIGSQSLYVTRSTRSSTGDDLYNDLIRDDAYPAQKNPVQTLGLPVSGGSPWELGDIEDGTFVVGIVGTNVTYYAFRYIQWGAFLLNLFSDTYLTSIVPDWAAVYSDVYQDIKTKVNPLQFITSVMWFPLNYLDFGTPTLQSIPVGYGSISASVKLLDGTQVIRKLRSFNIPQHTQASRRGSYLNTRPFSDYQLFYPPFGKFTLDPDIMADSEADLLDVYVNVDVRTGDATLTAQAGQAGSNILTWANSRVGVNYQVSQVLNSGMGIGQLAQVGAGIVAGGALAGPVGAIGAMVAGGANAIGNYIDGKIPSASMVGSAGGVNALQGTPQLITHQYKIADEDFENRGRPLCTLRTINSLQGYMMVSPANISISAEESELDEIKQLMEGGFYYE